MFSSPDVELLLCLALFSFPEAVSLKKVPVYVWSHADAAGCTDMRRFSFLLLCFLVDLLLGRLIKESEGAKCLFTPVGDVPLMVVKSDGGYGYDSTDLAAIKDRSESLSPPVQRTHYDRPERSIKKPFIVCVSVEISTSFEAVSQCICVYVHVRRKRFVSVLIYQGGGERESCLLLRVPRCPDV